jgi:hypothetical protein
MWWLLLAIAGIAESIHWAPYIYERLYMLFARIRPTPQAKSLVRTKKVILLLDEEGISLSALRSSRRPWKPSPVARISVHEISSIGIALQSRRLFVWITIPFGNFLLDQSKASDYVRLLHKLRRIQTFAYEELVQTDEFFSIGKNLSALMMSGPLDPIQQHRLRQATGAWELVRGFPASSINFAHAIWLKGGPTSPVMLPRDGYGVAFLDYRIPSSSVEGVVNLIKHYPAYNSDSCWTKEL